MPVDWSKYPEKFWHCQVQLKKWPAAMYRIVHDLTREQVREQIVEPWHEQRPFNVCGAIIKRQDEVEEIRVVQTPHPMSYYEDWYRAEVSKGNFANVIGFDTCLVPFWHPDGQYYTHELLFAGLPATTASRAVTAEDSLAPPALKAFIVHGHDKAALHQVARFLQELDIEPIILMEEAHKGRTLIEKLEQNSDAQYAVILCTPDDLGRAKDESELKPRARQNVVLELGYFIGALGRSRICVLYAEGVDMPTDVHGVGYHDLDVKGAWKLRLAQEMRAAGLRVDLNKAK